MDNPLKTYLGKDIPLWTRGILYLCRLQGNTFEVVNELLFTSEYEALQAYANIRNPESQMVGGKTYNELIKELVILHKNINNPEWVKELHEYI